LVSKRAQGSFSRQACELGETALVDTESICDIDQVPFRRVLALEKLLGLLGQAVQEVFEAVGVARPQRRLPLEGVDAFIRPVLDVLDAGVANVVAEW
jgi:hypothetical protein